MEIQKGFKLKDNSKGMLLALICPLIWSLSGVIAKGVPWPGLFLSSVRGVLTGLAMLIYMSVRRIPLIINKRTLLLGLTVPFTVMLYFPALKLTTAASAIALQYMEPVFLVLMCAVFLKTKYRASDYIAVGIATLGTVLIFLDSAHSGSMLGNVLALLSGVAFAGTYFFMTGQNTETRLSGVAIGGLMSGVGIFTTDMTALELSPGILLVVLLFGLFQISVPYIIMAKAMTLTSSLACGLIATVEMVLNPLWVYLFLGEIPGVLSLIGATVIMVSISVWCVYTTKRAEALTEA